MTITTEQVQDIQTTVIEVLKAGTYTNYNTTPTIYGENEKKSAKNVWIEVLNSNGNIIYAANSAPIYFEDTCELWIVSKNRSDINKLYADILNIFTIYKKITITKIRDIPLRSKYRKQLNLRLLDI